MPSLGVAALGAVVLGSVVLWVVARPGGQPGGRYLGEFFGVEAVLLFSCSLVLATLLSGISGRSGAWTGWPSGIGIRLWPRSSCYGCSPGFCGLHACAERFRCGSQAR